MSLLRLQAEQASDLGAQELITTVVLPALDADPPDRFVGQPGCLNLQIQGERGGDFSIDLEEGDVSLGHHDDPDCTLRLSDAAFGDLIRGRLDASAALQRGDLAVFGNPDVLTRLSELLARAELS
jgi:ubiquinone biosynthesis protein UbiJ